MPHQGPLHPQHGTKNTVNDQVLTAIATNYGKTTAQPGADLLTIIAPTVDADLYRVAYRVVSRIVTPAVGAGTITWVFTPRNQERWRVIAAAFENGDVTPMTLSVGVRDQANISGERRVLNYRVPGLQNIPFIGNLDKAAATEAGGTQRGETAAFVEVPRSTELLIIALTTSGSFDGGELALRMLLEVLPQEARYQLEAPSQEIVP